MTRYVLSPRAQADLSEIWNYTTGRWGSIQAEAYIRLLQAGIEAIAAAPNRGTACDEIRRGYHKYRSGSHILFYKVSDEGIEIVRILHERMDFGRHF